MGTSRGIFAVGMLAAAGSGPGNLTPALGEALAAYRGRYGGAPVRLVVNPSLGERASAAVAALGLDGLTVSHCDGCLVWEVWLEIAEGEGPTKAASETRPRGLRPRSGVGPVAGGGVPPRDSAAPNLLRQVEKNWEPMTPERARELIAQQLTLLEVTE